MRIRRFKIISTILAILLGLTALALSLFAYQLGLDNNPTPGRLRKLLAVLGVLVMLSPLLALLLWRLEKRFHWGSSFSNKIKKLDARSNAKKVTDTTPARRFFNSNIAFWATLGVVVVFLVTLWYITNGTMIHFQGYSNYYDLQANAFLAGQTSLLEEPTPELAALPNPYDWKARTGIHFVWDASYYHGKYYLYWGPVPALLAALVKAINPMEMQDQYLLLFFISGLTIITAVLLADLRKRYFPSAPAWTLTFFILVGGLCTPVFWLVNRPNVYETAIAACQFFLVMGIYAVIQGLHARTGQWKWLMWAGLSLGTAVGSRTTVVFSVFFIVGVTLFVLVKQWLKSHPSWKEMMGLLIPLALFACGLAWFNYARFGSIFESGMRYQLTGEALPKDMSQLFALRYIIPNTYLALLQPYEFKAHSFPFFIATTDNSWTRIIRMPAHYYFAEQVTGILYTIPLLWMLVVPFIALLRKEWRWVKEVPAERDESQLPGWIWTLLAGTFGVAYLTDAMFVMTTMRYLADFTPLLVILTSLLIMLALQRSRRSRIARVLLLAVLVILSLFTIVISLFINFTCGDRRIQHENPILYEKIVTFFDSLVN